MTVPPGYQAQSGQIPLLQALIDLSLLRASVPPVLVKISAMEILSSGGKYRLSATKQKYEGDYPPSLKLSHCVSKRLFAKAVYNHWTGLVDWTGGLDWWTDLKNHFYAF